MNVADKKRFTKIVIEFYEKLYSWEQAVAKNTGLSPQQLHTIEIVGAEGPIRMKPLAEKLSITTGTLTVMIDRLQESGYVERQKDPTDGRAFIIVVTEKGKAIYGKHNEYHLKLTEDIAGCLESKEYRAFFDFMDRVNYVL